MPFMRFGYFCAVVAACVLSCLASAAAVGRPTLAQPAISPDGRDVAFVCGADIWTVDANGGTARLLVADGSDNRRPIYSPDGKHLAFISSRSGSGDIYILTPATGALRRLTYDTDSSNDLDAWSGDGWIYFDSPSRNMQGQRSVYRVRATGGTALPIVTQPYVNQFFGAPSPDGQSVAFNARGFANNQWWRMGHSHLDDSAIYVRRGTGDKAVYERLTEGDAREVWPMWGADGRRMYYVSDRSGAQNIWERPIGGKARQITHFTTGRVVWPTISRNGSTIVFERGFDVWKLDTASGLAAPVAISLQGVLSQPARTYATKTGGFTDYRLSPDGKKIAFLVHGVLFATAASGGYAFAVSQEGSYAREFSWSPDSAVLAYASGTGHEDYIYTYEFAAKRRRRLTDVAADVRYLTYDPAAKGARARLAFEEGGRSLRVLDVASNSVRTIATGNLPLTPGIPDVGLAWSPDGRWIAYFNSDAHAFTNVWVANVTDPQPRAISFLSNVFANTLSWSPNGRFVLFQTGQRTEPGQVARVDLQPQVPTFAEHAFDELFAPTDKKKAPTAASTTQIDFRGIDDRLRYLPTNLDVDAEAISPDGKTALLTAFDAGRQNMYLYSLAGRDGHLRQITAEADAKGYPQWSPDGKSVYYLDGKGAIRRVALDRNNAITNITASARFYEDWNRDKVEAFDEAWSAIRDFYADPHTNGVNWDDVYARYLPQFEGAQTPTEMRRLLQLMVGELKSSHTNAYPPAGASTQTTGHLGLSFDRALYERDGVLHVTQVVAQSPAAVADVRVGDELLAVNGARVSRDESLEAMLDHTIGDKVVLTLRAEGSTRKVAVAPVSYATASYLRYRAWVADNRAYVNRLSGGRLGYVHLPDMEPAALAQFYMDLDAQAYTKEGVVIDIRSNQGGFVNAYALDVLSRRPYLLFTPRGAPTSPAREILGQHALEKPTVLIVNEETLSDGEDFTQGYETMHVGQVVGEPTAGWIIYTGAIRLIDGTIFRLPFTRVTTLRGQPMEMHPRPVDVRVQRQIGSSEDAQLKAAVETLLYQLAAKKRAS